MTTRFAIGGIGVLAGLYGLYLLLRVGLANLVQTVLWLAGGVIAHDGVVGPAMILVGVVVLAAVPGRVRGPVAAGLVVLGTVTVTGIPAMTRLGERPDNPTLLNRNYTVGWLVFAALVAVVTAVAAVRRAWVPQVNEDVVREPHDEL